MLVKYKYLKAQGEGEHQFKSGTEEETQRAKRGKKGTERARG